MKESAAAMTAMTRTAATLVAVSLLCAACGGSSEIGVPEASAPDPIVGLWSTASLFNGNLWVGYIPDGQVAYILDPSKAPGTLGGVELINAIYGTTGRWNRDGSVYKVVMSRGGREVGTHFYKLDGERLSECNQDGSSKAGGEHWSRKMPGDAKTLEFISAYMKALKEANGGK